MRRQGIFWMLTIPEQQFTPPTELPAEHSWIKGQKEKGSNTDYLHYQIVIAFTSKKSLNQVKTIYPIAHCELTKSAAANDYVFKEETRIENTQFELGVKPICRNSKTDWETVWESAKQNEIMKIPAHVRIMAYKTIRTIASDYQKPIGIEKVCNVYWGLTGTGKSHRAWQEAGIDAYSKDPRTKFWCGYDRDENVVIDEFRGGIDIAHMLRWLDKYPVRVEKKGTSTPLYAKKIWITSNIDPRNWYTEADQATIDALIRRLNITHFS